MLNISTIEESLLDSTRFQYSRQGLFTNAGNYHLKQELDILWWFRSGINTILTNIGDATDGASTVDISRIELRMVGMLIQPNCSATDGRIIGWNYVMNTPLFPFVFKHG